MAELTLQVFNHIAPEGLQHFSVERYRLVQHPDVVPTPDAILLRSHRLEIEACPDSVCAVARAGVGVNNVPVAALTARGIPVFNTPGANANAVSELVLAGMLMTSRHLHTAWAKTQEAMATLTAEALVQATEATKKRFKGVEIRGRMLGVVGLGAVGVQVANTAIACGMQVIGYDPAMSLARARELSAQARIVDSLEAMLPELDYLSLHVPLVPATKHLLTADYLKLLHPRATVLNFARAEVVDLAAVEVQLAAERLHAYVCDFPDARWQAEPRALILPHLGASTLEAEAQCASMAAQHVRNYLEYGHIQTAVNYPDCTLATTSGVRIGVAHANVPNMVSQISAPLAQARHNIVRLVNNSQGDVAYTLIELETPLTDAELRLLQAIPDVVRVRQMLPSA